MPNIFQAALFKNHIIQLLNEQSIENLSNFFFLPCTSDRKEKINQFIKNVSLNPTDCIYENFKQYSSSGDEFIQQDLDSTDEKKELSLLKLTCISLKKLRMSGI